MVINSYKPFLNMTREIWPHLLLSFVYVTCISALDLQYHLEVFNFPVPIVAVLGTVIGLLLAFRTNSAYQRWWEARILWGAIVNDSRTWVRQLITFTNCPNGPSESDPVIREMALRQVAWCYALSRALRGQPATQDLSSLVSQDEMDVYQGVNNAPNHILLNNGKALRKLYDENRLELFQFVELEQTLLRLTNNMGGCERIRNTVFPMSYSKMVHGMNYLFVFLLPFGLVNVPAIGLVGTSLVLAVGFLMIQQVSIYLQDPFSNRPSDTPMLALSRTIEINIKQMLGEDKIPEPAQPIDGVLM